MAIVPYAFDRGKHIGRADEVGFHKATTAAAVPQSSDSPPPQAGDLVRVTDGQSSGSVLAMFDGTNWKYMGEQVHLTESFVSAAQGDIASKVIYIAPKAMTLKRVDAVWGVASTSGTLQVQRLQATEDVGGGDDLLASTIDLSGTADTVNNGTLTSTTANLALSAGDRLALEFAGTLTNQARLNVTLVLEPTPFVNTA